jgi:hypothetical protein
MERATISLFPSSSVAIIDAADFDRADKYRWFLHTARDGITLRVATRCTERIHSWPVPRWVSRVLHPGRNRGASTCAGRGRQQTQLHARKLDSRMKGGL